MAGALLLPSAAAGAAVPGLIRVLGVSGRTGRILVGIPHAGARGGRPSAVAAPSGIVLATVDAQPFTGYENAIYAADDNTVWITHAGVIRAATLLHRGLRQITRADQWPTATPGLGAWTVLA